MTDLEPEPRDAPARDKATPVEQVPLGRALILPAAVLAVVGLTAAWSLLGAWAAAGIGVGLLILVGALSSWRQGARPRLPRPAARPDGGRRERRARKKAAVPGASKTGAPIARPRRPGRAARTPGGRPSPASRRRTAAGPRRPATPGTSRRKQSRAGKTRRGRDGAAALLAVMKWLNRKPRKKAPAKQKPPKTRTTPAPQAPAPAAPAPTPTPAPAAGPPVPQPGPPVTPPRPAAAPAAPTPASSHGGTVSSNVQAAADALHDHIGGAVFNGMHDFTTFVGSLDVLLHALYDSLGSVNARFEDDEPINPLVIDHLEELRSLLLGPLEFARENSAVFATAHQEDLDRLENPRPGEEKMDYSRQ